MEQKSSQRNFLVRLFLAIPTFFKNIFINRRSRLAVFSALLFCLAYPPLPFGFLAYFCLVPILCSVAGEGFKKGFKTGYLFGFVQGVILLYWVGMGIRSYAESANVHDSLFLDIFLWWVAPIGAPIALALIQALFTAVLFGIYGWLSRGKTAWLLAFPLVWSSVEYFRTVTQFAFPWIELAYTQAKYVPMIQTAAWWGDLGIGFSIAVLNLLLFLAWKNRQNIRHALILTGFSGLIILAAYLYGSSIDYQPAGQKMKLGLLQGNVSLREKFSPGGLQLCLDRHLALAQSLAQDSCDLIILPETMIRDVLLLNPEISNRFALLARTLKADLLIGTFDGEPLEDKYCYYNSAVQCNSQGVFDYVYHKTKLVPFSEKIPYIEYFPFISNFYFGQSDFCMGDSITIFKTVKGAYAVLICFEVGFSEYDRQAVARGAEFLVTITIDTWWGRSTGPYQHAYMIPFRAVENRRWVARAANTGFSFFCDPNGRIKSLGSLFKQSTFTGEITLNNDRTFYVKAGFWMPKLLLFANIFVILGKIMVIKIRRRAGQNQ